MREWPVWAFDASWMQWSQPDRVKWWDLWSSRCSLDVFSSHSSWELVGMRVVVAEGRHGGVAIDCQKF